MGVFLTCLYKLDVAFPTFFNSRRYNQSSSLYGIRPPTGVDLALGLSGYDKVGVEEFPPQKQRPPTTLQPLKDEDEEMKRRIGEQPLQGFLLHTFFMPD